MDNIIIPLLKLTILVTLGSPSSIQRRGIFSSSVSVLEDGWEMSGQWSFEWEHHIAGEFPASHVLMTRSYVSGPVDSKHWIRCLHRCNSPQSLPLWVRKQPSKAKSRVVDPSSSGLGGQSCVKRWRCVLVSMACICQCLRNFWCVVSKMFQRFVGMMKPKSLFEILVGNQLWRLRHAILHSWDDWFISTYPSS